MQDFDLSDAVSSFSHHSSAIGTLWGIYVAATFAGAGFGISLEERFNYPLAGFLSVGFLAFTIGHWHLLKQHIVIQDALQADIRNHLGLPDPPTEPASSASKFSSHPFAISIDTICRNSSKRAASLFAHIVIDICVLALIWSMAAGLDPLNFASA